jgi:hypothetical protein
VDKTLKLIRSGAQEYDEQEVKDLAAILKPLLFAPYPVRRRLQQLGVTVTPANFYSEIPTIDEIEASFKNPQKYCEQLFDPAAMNEWLKELDSYADEFNPPVEAPAGTYGWGGAQVSWSDAMALYCTIRKVKPKHVVEIGSGSSSLISIQALAKNASGRLTCIEPYPADYLRSNTKLKLLEKKAQELTPEFFNDELRDGDVLFIDSTHTVKHGSDCLHIYLNLLPNIKRSIYVHVHDVYLPFTFPMPNLRDRQIYWTEQYLLGAYLTSNPRTEVLYGSAYHWNFNREALTAFMRGRYRPGGASLWFKQIAGRD